MSDETVETHVQAGPRPRTVPWSVLDSALASVNLDDGTVRLAYSGRAMYGRTCLGIVVGGWCDVVQLFVHLTMSATDPAEMAWTATDNERLARSLRYDALGRDIVVYFPGWTLDAER